MSAGLDVSELELLGLDFDVEFECEAIAHEMIGAGSSAQWVERGHCPKCERKLMTFVCTPCKKYWTDNPPHMAWDQSGCGKQSETALWNLTYTRISGEV